MVSMNPGKSVAAPEESKGQPRHEMSFGWGRHPVEDQSSQTDVTLARLFDAVMDLRKEVREVKELIVGR